MYDQIILFSLTKKTLPIKYLIYITKYGIQLKSEMLSKFFQRSPVVQQWNKSFAKKIKYVSHWRI